jgi:hypothetical protein
VFEEVDDPGDALEPLCPRDESAVHADHQGADAKSACARGHDAVVSWKFSRSAQEPNFQNLKGGPAVGNP